MGVGMRQFPMNRPRSALAAFFSCFLVVVSCSGKPSGPATPHRLGIYYWSPLITADRWAAMAGLEPDDIYVKAGAVERGPQGLRWSPPIVKGILASPKGARIHAVFHHTVRGPAEKAMMPSFIASWLGQFQASMARGGVTFSGIQLDLEGDWDVKDYPDLMARLPLGSEWARSAFVLPAQIRGPEEVAALDVFDQVVLSSYDFSWDQQGFRPTDIPWTIDFIKRNFPHPERVTLAAATYGVVSVLDAGGRARIPLLDLAGAESWAGKATPMGQSAGREIFRVEKDMTFKEVTVRRGETLALWQPKGNRVASEIRRGLSALPNLGSVALFSFPIKSNFQMSDTEFALAAAAIRKK